MRHLCTDCNYIFDEAFWELELAIKPGTRLDDAQDIFACPNCGALSDMFEPIREEILYADNPAEKRGMEIEHIPLVRPTDDIGMIEFIVWTQLHPSEDEHRITSVGLYDEYGDLVFEQFFEAEQEPIGEFDVSDFDSFELRARCNLHWVWSTGLIENIEL